jgi:hypothetical protein
MKAFINLERKTDELKCNYLAKVQDLEQRYQANLKVLDYEKLSFEYDKIRSSNLKPIRESDEIIYSQLELLEKNVGRKLEVLEMKNQLLEDSIKILERENLLNQEAFEKEKKKIGESFDIVQMENKRLHQQLKEEEEKSSDRIATLMEENQSNIAEIQTKSQDIQDKLAQVESTLLENRKFDERLAALENIFSNLVSSEFTTGYEDLPQADNHSNKEDANKIRIVFEYNERMNK